MSIIFLAIVLYKKPVIGVPNDYSLAIVAYIVLRHRDCGATYIQWYHIRRQVVSAGQIFPDYPGVYHPKSHKAAGRIRPICRCYWMIRSNHTASKIKSRHRNKFLCAELIILTSVLNIEEFHQNVYGHEHEPIEQLKRRCGTYIEIKPNGIIISRWDNTIRQYIPPAPKKREEVHGEIQNLLPFLTPATLPDDVQ